tara:strand:- start:255 stop:446 length:192 start_codon:yes stop_codon:yes gene_type:complete
MSAEQRADRLLVASILGGAALTGLAAFGFDSGLLPDVVVYLAAGAWMVSFYSAFIHLANLTRG